MSRANMQTWKGRAVKLLLIVLVVMSVNGMVPLLPADWGSRAYAAAENYTIDTIAGTGAPGFSGDGGPAASAHINIVYHIAVDAAGNLYFADSSNHVIRKVDTSGIITTVAGRPGVEANWSIPSGDGGPATSATLRFPGGVTFDSAGNMYITELGYERVRKVDTNGIISTVAGSSTGAQGYAGDGGPATSALLNNPVDVAVDSAGNLYIAEIFNHTIRKVDQTTGIITTVVGTGASGFSGDGGPATSAQLNTPYSVDFDDSGNLYIADLNNNRVRKVETSGNISTVAGTGVAGYSGDGGPATAANMWNPIGLAVDDDGTLYVAENSNHIVRKISPTGIITTVAGTGTFGDSGDGGPAKAAQLRVPLGIDLDHNGNLFVADRGNHKIKKLEAVTHTVTFGKNGGDTEATPSTLIVTDGDTVAALPAPPTRPGYAFAGWNTLPNGGGTVFDATTVVSGNVTVYAQWSLNPPNAPANFRASPGNGQASLTWDSVTSAVYYSLYIGTASGAYDPLPLTTVTGVTYTATGLVNDTTYYFAVKAHNAAGASGFSNEARATPRAPQAPSTPDSGSESGRPTVQVVDGNSGSIVSTAYILRSSDADGRRQAEVELTRDQAAHAVERLKTLESDYAKMLITDVQERDAKLIAKFPKASADLLSESKIRMEISATRARVVIPDTTFEGVTDGLRFRIEPAWDEDLASIERLATTDPLVLEAARGGTVETVGRPMTIGSNATSDRYEAILPLTGATLNDEQLKRVAVFALYDDGTKELARGSIVPYDGEDRLGIRFPVSAGKTGTFTVIRWMNPVHQAFLFGYADGTFAPDRNVTRAEVAAMLVRVFDRDEDAAPGEFPDVGDGHWAKEYIDRASGMSLMIGYPDGIFKPDATITRAEMASAIAPLLPEVTGASAGFTDTEGSWAKAVIEKANAAGIVYGYEDGTFRPNSSLTRAEAVTMLDRLLGRGPLIGAPQQWPDVTQAHWAYGYIQEASMDHSYEKQQDGTEKYIPEP
ncbi:NHL domain-containing protein [Paenibacillus arenilitoris]|uniref:S-layer homology domain-containing protein n=1 Tax=Paenibacillus arenilitoris TaxID=2772299 RepID=A0A927CS58_9BACL|nr:S-layer homology domain-containing protein [Paenibacillus arenilitoris]MBD2871898.1 S-layer homology domain-containing protein [Paenibacillus arenilitoris]